MNITAKQLAAIAGRKQPTAMTAEIAAAFNLYAPQYGFDTPRRVRMALANFSVETGGFTKLAENLNYSAKRLTQVWRKRFPTLASAQPYANNPRALANKVYGSRMGNKGKPDAGWLYRGSGPGQLTGYDNFALAEKLTGLPFTTQPELMRRPLEGMKAALALWVSFGMHKYADRGDAVGGRKKWNGGDNGLAEVEAALKRAEKVNIVVQAAPAPATAPATAKETEPPTVTQDESETDEAAEPRSETETKSTAPAPKGAIAGFATAFIVILAGLFWSAACLLPDWLINWLGYAAKCTGGQ